MPESRRTKLEKQAEDVLEAARVAGRRSGGAPLEYIGQ